MARRKRGRRVDGFVLVDKPMGLTSTAVVGKVRWALSAQKAGHAGTLDPMATGLLVIALGEATKALPLITDDLKAYRFTLRWGEATDTDDAEGRVIAESPVRPTPDAVTAALPAFTGEIEQVPPAYSAVKVDGARAYDLAREGAAATLAARPLYVESLSLVARPDPDHATLDLVCGKGGYVRAIARDLGQALGTAAHVTALRRVWSGPFAVADAIGWERLEAEAKSPALDAAVMPIAEGLARCPVCHVTEVAARKLRNGNPAPVASTDAKLGETAWARCGQDAVAIGTYGAGMLSPQRVFRAEDAAME